MSVVAIREPIPSSISRSELAALIRSTHERYEASAIGMVGIAIECGDLLIGAKEIIGFGSFEKWVTETVGLSLATSSRYMRVAAYKSVTRTAPDINAALIAITGANPRSRIARSAWIAAARDLREQGHNDRQIAEALGVSVSSVHYAFNPERYRKHRAASAHRKKMIREGRAALAREAERKSVQRVGGSIAEAYSHLRKAAAILDDQATGGDTGDVRTKASLAWSNTEKAIQEVGLMADYQNAFASARATS